MKLRFLLFGSFFAFILIVTTSIFNGAHSNENGAPASVTGSPRDGNSCIKCHTPATNFTGSGSVTSNIPAGGYTAGQTYAITAAIVRNGHVRFGFEASPQDTTAARNYIGSMTITNTATTQLVSTNYITHKSTGTAGTNSLSWTFNWTAPATGKGPAVFYAAFNASNDNNSSNGDSIFLASYKVYECFAPSTPGSITGNTSVCPGSPLTYSVAAVGGASTYNWILPSGWTGTSTTNSITVTAGTSGGTVSVTAGNSCGTSAASTLAVTVNSASVASISISTTTDTICSGSNVTFNATPINGGTTPVYQWKLNDGNVGTGTSSYSNSSLANGDKISCVLTSDLACVTQSPASSNTITMTVNPLLSASVSIATPKDTVCSGTNVTFTATATNGGTTPVYQWKLNGVNTGTNSSTYSNSILANADKIACVLTSNLACVTGSPATSNTIAIDVNLSLPASVSITTPGDTSCSGTLVNFTAAATNGGTAPVYQWKLNGGNVGSNSVNYADSTLANGDKIACVLTSNLACVTQSPATSNTVTMTVNPVLSASVLIATGKDTICSGTNVTFTATPTNGGTAPVYQWKLNGANTGANSSTYSNSALANGDKIACVLTSNLACVTASPATSDTISMIVNPVLNTSVSISASDTNICSGQSVTFDANPVNGGSAPGYQWKKNGAGITGATSNVYSSSALANGDIITLAMNSSAACPSPVTAISNSVEIEVKPILIPSVSISSNSGNTICNNQQVTFNATVINGGTNPEFQWFKNGLLLSNETSSNYTSLALLNGDSVTLTMISNAVCAAPDTVASNAIVIQVVNNAEPSITISSSATDSICQGQNVTFTAQAFIGGTAPTYQWLKNGIALQGDTFSSYSITSLADGDSIGANMISNSACVVSQFASSNSISFKVIPYVSPTISINPDSGFTICLGLPVVFSTSVTNQGSSPAYQWLKNGINITGETFSAYADSTLADNDSISVIMTSDGMCVSPPIVSAGPIAVHVLNDVVPAVIVNSNAPNGVCQGQSIVLTAQPTNGGANPSFQWFKNSSPLIEETTTTYIDSLPVDSDIIQVSMISNAMCVSPDSAISNPVITDVFNNVVPSVSVQSNSTDSICPGQNVSFTPVPVAGGRNPAYQWKINGTPLQGDTLNTYSTAYLVNGDSVSVDMISDYICLITPFASSQGLVMNVLPNVLPTISLSPDSGFTICPGQEILFNTTVTNSGISPVYQWTKNGVNINGETSPAYSTFTLSNGDIISCLLTSNAQCASPNTVLSAPDTMQTYAVAPVNITQNNDTLIASQGTAYQWFRNDNIINGAVNQTLVLTSNGNYTVLITDEHGCTSMPDTVNITSLGISGLSLFNSISVFPNPTEGIFYIDPGQIVNVSSVVVKLYDINGRLIIENLVSVSNFEKIKLDIHSFDNGIYLLNIRNDKDSYNIRLVKE